MYDLVDLVCFVWISPAFSNRDGTAPADKAAISCPSGSDWLCEWRIEPLSGCPVDSDGWTYGFDFPKLEDATQCRR